MSMMNTAIPASNSPDGTPPARPIPLLDLKAQFASIQDELLRTVEGVLQSQHFILGKEVQLLEEEIAAFVRAPFGVGCASGSDALYLALCAERVGPDDEVITTPFTFGATAGAIARVGAKPVFVDIQRETFNIDPEQIAAAITQKTRAVIPVHLFGLAADLSPILKLAAEHNIAVIEDAAQAIGATYGGRPLGSWGEYGCFSFFPSKNLGCAGDGGLVTARDQGRAERLRLLRAHGCSRKYHYEILGTNSRLDALQAAILRVKLRHLPCWQRARQEHANLYRELFRTHHLEQSLVSPSVPAGSSHVYNQFVIRSKRRDALRAHLANDGISTEIYYPEPLHLQPAFRDLGYAPGSMPEAEAACAEALALPIYPELRSEDQERVAESIADFFHSHPACN